MPPRCRFPWPLRVVALIPLLLFVSCDRGAASSGGGDVVTIRFWNGFTGPDGRTMLRLVQRFNRENRGVHVIMQRME